MKKSYHSIMVPAAEAKMTRQMLRLEDWWVSLAGVVDNDFGSLAFFLELQFE
jgi:hypothetical protein